MSFFVHDRLTPWPKIQKLHLKCIFNRKKCLKNCLSALHHLQCCRGVSIVSRTAKKIDAIVQPNNPIKSSTPLEKEDHQELEVKPTSDQILRLKRYLFIENARNFCLIALELM